jgi:hypothetical protein
MRQRLGAVRNSLRGPPAPPVPRHELAEVEDFLGWLDDDNFTFLGFREYLFNGSGESAAPGLGVLADPEYRIFDGLRDLPSLPPDVQDFIRRRELLVITKSNRRSTVHRPAHMDVIGIRRFNSSGEVIGIRLFLGLLTSPAYNRDPRAIPLLRRKIRHTVERSGLSPASHDGKALLHIIDNLPRDELFQGSEDELYDTSSVSSRASSLRPASVMTAICGGVSRRSSNRHSPGGFRRFTPISTIRRWRGSISLSIPPAAKCRWSTWRRSNAHSPRPAAPGRIISRRRRQRPLVRPTHGRGCAGSSRFRFPTRR